VPTIVRYRAKPESADENQRLIEAVFTEIEERQLGGFTYKVFSFQAFTADLAERCDTPTVTMGATVVGGYR